MSWGELPGRRSRARRAAIVASVVLAVAGIVPLARAGIADAHLTSPGAFGTIDFGDRVPYRLDGGRCTRDAVHVEVMTTSSVVGASSTPVVDALAPETCVGQAVVPSEAAVRATGWDAGDPIKIDVVSAHSRVPLVYERVEAEYATKEAGNPTVVAPAVRDRRGGKRDRAVEMNTGDIVGLGAVDLTNIDSISLRVCLTLPKPHAGPSLVEVRQGSPTGPVLVGPVDVGNDYPLGSPQSKSNFGWPDCWQLQPWPVTEAKLTRAPKLYLALVASASPVQIGYVDFNGTGAKAPDTAPADPPGTVAMPWEQWTMSGCQRDDDGTIHNQGDTSPQGYAPIVTGGLVGPAGCSLTYNGPGARQLHNVLLRFELKMGDFADNGAVMIGGHEVQLREGGEWLTGGLYGDITAINDFLVPDQLDAVADQSGGGYPAERLNVNSYRDWNEVEIVQLGSRHVVRLNGRTVADSSTAWPDPKPYTFSVSSQPQFGFSYDVTTRYDNWYFPNANHPSSWSNLAWRNFRVYQCQSPTDPVCAGGPGVHG